MQEIIYLLVGFVVWGVLIGIIFKFIEIKKEKKLQETSNFIVDTAKQQKISIIEEANSKKEEIISNAEEKREKLLSEVKILEERILKKEDKLDSKIEDIEKQKDIILEKEKVLEENFKKLSIKEDELVSKLNEISSLTKEEARELVLQKAEIEYEKDLFSLLEKKKWEYNKKEKEYAREVILKSIQQYSNDVTNEVTSTVISLESDDIKWRLIWKEGRNIVTFERMTWVSLIIDDTPDTVFISSFDLYRRYIAKISLEKLLQDKRIQPARIEEIVEATKDETEDLLFDLGQKALQELWLENLPNDVVKLIWKLRFRTSYGQNILKHSIEVAYIAESIAKDLWADVKIAKLWGLLHDLWKALDHDIEWTHPEIWWKVARKNWLDEKVIDIIENHHGETSSMSLETAIVQIADAISSVRPWARRESIELYLKRVKELEAIAQSFPWVSKAYALSAGREVRVFVDSANITDIEALKIARDIADKIQNNLSFAWEVKVNLIRETRVIEYAK